jgi:hypothetical protein
VAILIVAEAYGLPFLPALQNLTKDQDIKKGVNFAFAGSSALEYKFFTQHAIMPPATSNSLSVQLGWFKELKPSLCKSKEGYIITPLLLCMCQILFFSICLT